MTMNGALLGWSGVALALGLVACGGGSSSPGSSSSSPTAPSGAAICSPAVVTICGGSFNGGPTTFGQVTVTAGGAPSCRVALGEAIPISFTIVNPNSTAAWQINTNTRQAASPSSGNASSAGPFQATVQFTTFGGDNTTDDTIHLTINGSGGCDFKIYGHK